MISDEEYFDALEAASDVPDEDELVLLEMSDEEVTLSLARDGISPEDTRRTLAKAMERFISAIASRRADDRDLERWEADGGR